MNLGFTYATRGGISICADDLRIPVQKSDIIKSAEAEVQEIAAQYTSGLVTQGERYNKVVDIWGRAGDQVAKAMMDQLSVENVYDSLSNEIKKNDQGKPVMQESFNSIYMMADSGARAQQLKLDS